MIDLLRDALFWASMYGLFAVVFGAVYQVGCEVVGGFRPRQLALCMSLWPLFHAIMFFTMRGTRRVTLTILTGLSFLGVVEAGQLLGVLQ